MNGYNMLLSNERILYIIPADSLSQDNLTRSCTCKLQPAQARYTLHTKRSSSRGKTSASAIIYFLPN